MYKCELCGKTYDNVNEYVKCVQTCATDRKRKEAEEHKKKLAAEKENRRQEIKRAEAYLNGLYEKYYEDYDEPVCSNVRIAFEPMMHSVFDLFGV